MTDAVAFVLQSEARRSVLARLAEGRAARRSIVESCAASESAVYEGLARLAERDLATETDDGTWQLTGTGRLVADAVQRCDRIDELVGTAPSFWSNHDLECLPQRFRRSIDQLCGCTILRSPEEDPYRVARQTEAAIRQADEVGVVTPIYSDRHATAFLECDAPQRRLVMTPNMVERILRDQPRGPDGDGTALSIRVESARIKLTVTDDELVLSLPTCSGDIDAETAIHTTAPEAVEWGRDLMEYYWERGTPVEAWIADELPEIAPDADHDHARADTD